MEQHPYTQWVYWLPIRLVYFNRGEYKNNRTIKWFNVPLNGMLWRGKDEEKRFDHFLNKTVSSIGNKNLLEAALRIEGRSFREMVSNAIGADIETIRKTFS
jgi:hypothetical protein